MAYQCRQLFNIHGLGQAIVDGLIYQGVIWNLAFALDILKTGNLVREDMGDQVFSVQQVV